MSKCLVLTVLLLFCSAGLIMGQAITLIPDPTLVITPENCATLQVGSTLDFVRDPSCGPNVTISNDLGATIIFSTSDVNFSYTFAEPGEYVIFCNSSPTSAAVTALCITVPEIIPTLGEWSIVMLFLLMSIVSVAALRSYEQSSFRYY